MTTKHIGKVYGQWTVLKFSHRKGGKCFCYLQCSCGTIAVRDVYSIAERKNGSCGCKMVKDKSTQGGLSGTKAYRSWYFAKLRCTNPSRKDYPRYGGRGIKFHERWNEFSNFISDMGHPPTDTHSLDRIDNNGNYEPGNCRWVCSEEQRMNRRDTRPDLGFIEYRGTKYLTSELCKNLNLPLNTIRSRLNKGWPPVDAIETPISKRWGRSELTLTYNGETRTLREWSDHTGIAKKVIATRYERGWTPERILETPVQTRKPKDP